MRALKKSIVVVKAAFMCLAHAFIIAIARLNGDSMCKSYRNDYGFKKPVEDLFSVSGVNLRNAGGYTALQQFQDYLSDYKIIVYDGLSPHRVMFSGNSFSNKKLYLLYYLKSKHSNVISNLKAAMTKRYICIACDTLYHFTHKCDKACSLCTGTPPCRKDQKTYCGTCNRWLLIEKYFQNHVTLKVKGKLVCQWREVCRNCSFRVSGDSKHECFKKFCNSCYKNHFC